jgi:DUF4097 and DUF4098 domain-containing protein YvlB
MKKNRLHILGVGLACVLVVSCGVNSSIVSEDGTTYEGNRTTVNGSVSIGDRCVIKGNCRTVNGRVSVGSDSQVGSLKSVNGSIKLGDNVVVDGDLETVNGGIHVGPAASVAGYLETVNGPVSIAAGGVIEGTLKTVNGGIDLDDTEVTGDLITTNGDLTIENGSRVIGNLVIRGGKGKERKPPTITVSGGSVIEGDLEIHDKDRGVRLVLIGGGQVTGATTGAIVETVDGDQDERPE